MGSRPTSCTPVAPNLLERQFTVEAGNDVRVSDITYVWTRQGWMYLAVIVDLFSRRVVGWSISERMTAEVTLLDAAFLLLRKRSEHRPEVPAQFPVQNLASALWHKNNMILAFPARSRAFKHKT